jgi:hypothetical protein
LYLLSFFKKTIKFFIKKKTSSVWKGRGKEEKEGGRKVKARKDGRTFPLINFTFSLTPLLYYLPFMNPILL